MSQTNPSDLEADILAAEFIQHGDKTRAWRVAFPDSEAAPETQWVKASKAFDSDKVQIRIEELQKVSKKQSEKEFTMSVGEIKKVLAMVIQKGVKNKPDGTPTNLAAVVSAAKELNAMDGNHSPLKTQEINANDLTPWDEIEAYEDKLDG